MCHAAMRSAERTRGALHRDERNCQPPVTPELRDVATADDAPEVDRLLDDRRAELARRRMRADEPRPGRKGAAAREQQRGSHRHLAYVGK